MKIVVLNPNSSVEVTRSMERCLAPLAAVTAHEIVCDRLPEAPLGIETDADVALVAPMTAEYIAASDADAFVIACFSDPGLQIARAADSRPVFGIAESAYVRALLHGRRFGVISLGPSSVARHLAMIEGLGLTGRLAGDRAINMSVAEANDLHGATGAIEATGRDLRDTDGADVLILGCAGMGEHRPHLQQALGCIVIDPVQAAVADAITALDLDYRKGA